MLSEHPSVQSICPAAMKTRPGNHAWSRDKSVKTSGNVHIRALKQAFPTEHCHSLLSGMDAAGHSLTGLNV